MKGRVIIPVRYGSTRFPGKALALVDGAPLIRRVYSALVKYIPAELIIVSTDDDRIVDCLWECPTVVKLDQGFENGTERCWATLVALGLEKELDWVVNVQGDEIIEGVFLPQVVDNLIHHDIVTLSKQLEGKEIQDPNTVKVVLKKENQALYFSRLLDYGRHHIGVYGYKPSVLEQLVNLPNSVYADNESLEQLGWMQWGYDIRVLPYIGKSKSINAKTDIDE